MRQIKNICTWVAPKQYSQNDLLTVLGLKDNERARRIFLRAGIERRHIMLDPAYVFANNIPPLQLPELGTVCAHLAGVSNLIEVSNLAASQYRLPNTSFSHVQHYWCVGAIRGLELATKQQGDSVVLTVDINSQLRWYPDLTDINDIVNFALFGDGMACAIVGDTSTDKHSNIGIVDFAYYHDERNDLARYDHGSGKFYLGRDIPQEAPAIVENCIEELLDKHNIPIQDIKYWIVHPGGRKILDRIENHFKIQSRLYHSREILRQYGNIGASSLLFVLKDVMTSKQEDSGYGIMIGFGPGHVGGFSAGACLLQW